MSTYFSLIPSGVLENEKLSDGSKITYALILGLSNRYGYCFATNGYLSNIRNVSISTIQRQLFELKKSKCIVIELNQRNDRRITPIVSPSNYEIVSKNSKNKQYGAYDNEELEEALDKVWKNIK